MAIMSLLAIRVIRGMRVIRRMRVLTRMRSMRRMIILRLSKKLCFHARRPVPPPRAFRESSRGVALDALKNQKKELEEIQDSMISLQNEVRSLQKIIQEMCTSLVRCDDMILLERDLLHQGSIFTSNGQTEGLLKRTPLTLRTSVLNITNEYNIPLMQRTYEWNGSSELDL